MRRVQRLSRRSAARLESARRHSSIEREVCGADAIRDEAAERACVGEHATEKDRGWPIAGQGDGYPATIRVDRGSEFISRDMDLWAYQRGVTLDFSRPGKPTGNSFIEAFNGRFRAECPGVSILGRPIVLT